VTQKRREIAAMPYLRRGGVARVQKPESRAKPHRAGSRFREMTQSTRELP